MEEESRMQKGAGENQRKRKQQAPREPTGLKAREGLTPGQEHLRGDGNLLMVLLP